MSDQIGAEIRDAWAKISADPETTPETTPERNGAEIRDAWAKIAADNDSTETTDNDADNDSTETTTMTDNNADNDSTETTDKDDTPTVNGVELDSVVGVANAFAHLGEAYNAGDITVRSSEGCSSEDLVIIQSRRSYFSHMYSLLEAQKQGHISIQHIAAGTNRDGGSCLNIEVVGGNDSTEKTVTEYLTATDNTNNSIDGAAKITHTQNDMGVWQTDDGERLEDDLDEYRAECSCGEEFGSWVKATRHVSEE